MLRKSIAIMIACAVLQSASAASGWPQVAGGDVEVQERIRALPPGSTLELKLTNGEKLKGRLGPVGQEGFKLRISRNGTIMARNVAFTEVRSVHVKRGMSTGAKIGLGVGIFAGVAVLVTALVLAAIGRNG